MSFRLVVWGSVFYIVGCSDYALESTKQHEKEGGGAGSIVVGPTQISVDALCADQVESKEVIIKNEGVSNLEIYNIVLDGANWNMILPPLPFQIPPNGSEKITLDVGVGSGIVTIESNDAESPLQFVQIYGIEDSPPSIIIKNPNNGESIPEGGTTLKAKVEDEEDVTASLFVHWYSSVDGFLGMSAVDEEGKSKLPYTTQYYGPQTITAEVQDSCGNLSSDIISICQQYVYESESFDLSTWQFEGSATWDSANQLVELTTPDQNLAGTAFSTSSEILAENVDIEFQFYVSGGSGADGFSLTALDTSRMTGFVGQTGEGIGYGGLPGWSIEVDTYYNSIDPTEEDHIAFSFDGQYDSPQAWAVLPDMEDNQWHTMNIHVHAPHVWVEIDGITYIDQNISGHYNFMSFVGFTAGTGSLTNYHLIDALRITESVCD